MKKPVYQSKASFLGLYTNLKNSFLLLKKNDPLRLAGATAFFANFAIPPILLILIRLFGFFVDRKTLASQIFDRISQVLIPSSANEIRQVLRNIRAIDHGWWATILSFLFFIFVATTLFNVIKNSVEQIWHIGFNAQGKFLPTLKNRGRSLGIVLLAGILSFVGIVFDSLQAIIGAYLNDSSPTFGKWLLTVLNQLIFAFTISIWFTILFRYLTNARPHFKIAIQGGLLMGVLFTFGRYVLRILLPLSNIENIYGASGSIVLVMLFVFYTSLIFYFAACYIKVISDKKHVEIRPLRGAFNYELKEVKTHF